MSPALFLELDAPFSAWRWLQAGVFRATFPVIPHSAAWGLVLNVAGIDTRGDSSQSVTPIASDAPPLELAVGVKRPGERATLYQQLHGYPVGAEAGKMLKVRARGNKYQIAPVKREMLVGQIAVIGVRGSSTVIDRVRPGLCGQLAVDRYGLPFAGDNQLLYSRIEVVEDDGTARWYSPVQPGRVSRNSTRLTTNIDRADASRTEAPLFAPAHLPGKCPEAAWVRVGPSTRP